MLHLSLFIHHVLLLHLLFFIHHVLLLHLSLVIHYVRILCGDRGLWWSAGLVIEMSRVRAPAGVAGKFSSPGSTFCADSYSLPQEHVNDPVIVGGRLQINRCTLRMWFRKKCHCKLMHHGMFVWCTQNVLRDGSSFTRHRPCNNQILL